MASVDDRIVRMEFDNASFEKKLGTTLASLDKLNHALKFEGATKGLSDIQGAAGKLNFSAMGSGIDGISKKFLALSTVAITALANITNKAVNAGLQLAKSLSLDQVISGFREYETNIGSIQTILANTKAQGTNLQMVNAALDELNTYSDKTIYNFSEMARNIGTFTAAGVDLKTSTQAIKGIANLAAISGSSADQASTAMYQLSQAIASGSVKLMDWNSVVNAGMGGKTFQNALFEAGKAMGKFKDVPVGESFDEWTKKGNTFRESLKDGWLTADVLTTTLGAVAGEMSVADLKAKGFSESQANMLVELGKTGIDAATKVRTFTQLISTVKESIGSGWSATFRILIGNFTEATDLFTGLSNTIGKFVSTNADARNKILQSWKDLGGRAILIDAIRTGFQALGKILTAVSNAFKQIFPPMTGQRLLGLTLSFQKLMEALTPSVDTIQRVTRIFAGLFSIFSIGWNILKEGVKFIGQLITSLTGIGSGGILKGLAKIGDFFTNLQAALVKGGGIKKFFAELTAAVKEPIEFIKDLKDAIIGLFTGFNKGAADAVGSSVQRVGDRFEHLKDVLAHAADFFGPFGRALQRIGDVLNQAGQIIGNWFKELGQKIADQMDEGDFNAVIDALNVTLLGAIAGFMAKFLKGGLNINFAKDFMGSLSGTLDQLTGTLKAMQTQIKAQALEKIAIAVGILTASVVALSLINSAALTKALTAMSVGFGQLLGAFAVINQMSSDTKSAAQFGLVAAGLNLLASALLILSGAVAILGQMSWGELSKGLLGVTVLLGVITVAIIPLTKNTKGMMAVGAALIEIAVALTILGGAVKVFGTMSWGEMAKGFVGIAAGLTGIAIGMRLMPHGMILQGVALLAVATSLVILAKAIKAFAGLSWGELGKGFAAVAGGLLIIAGAMWLMPPDMPLIAAGLLLVSVSLIEIGKAMGIMGALSWGEIAKGLVAMAGALLILAAATYAMSGTISGAIAIGIVAVALGVLAEVLTKFAGLSWGDLLHGLVGVAAALAVLGLAAFILEPVIPMMIALGAALILIGGGFALVGAGAYLLAKAFEALAKSGKAGSAAIVDILKNIGRAIPAFAQGLAEGLISFVETIAKAAPVIMKALGALLDHLIDTVIKLIPKMTKAMGMVIDAIITLLYTKGPPLIQAGIFLLEQLLIGIRNNIYEITSLAIDILDNFLQAIDDNMDKIVGAGVNLLLALLQGMADNISKIVDKVTEIITTFITEIANHYVEIAKAGGDAIIQFITGIGQEVQKIIKAGTWVITQLLIGVGNAAKQISDTATWVITTFLYGLGSNAKKIVDAGVWALMQVLGGIAKAIPQIATSVTKIITTLIREIARHANEIVTAGTNALISFLQGLGKNALKIANAAADVVIKFINGLADSIRKHNGELRDAGANLIGAVISGMTFGLSDKLADVGKKLGEGLAGAAKKAKGFIKVVGDPYSLLTQHWLGEPMINGITRALDNDTTVEESSADLVMRGAETLRNSLSVITDALGDTTEFNPVITPVLDLTQVAADASRISDYIQSTQALTPTLSMTNAGVIATSTSQQNELGSESTITPNSVSFQQNIYAPEQLSAADIYKQTRNQITMAKEELAIP